MQPQGEPQGLLSSPNTEMSVLSAGELRTRGLRSEVWIISKEQWWGSEPQMLLAVSLGAGARTERTWEFSVGSLTRAPRRLAGSRSVSAVHLLRGGRATVHDHGSNTVRVLKGRMKGHLVSLSSNQLRKDSVRG